MDDQNNFVGEKDREFFELVLSHGFENMASDFVAVFGKQNKPITAMYAYLNEERIRKGLVSHLADIRKVERPLWGKKALDRAVTIAFADISQFVNPNGTKNFTDWDKVDSAAVKVCKKKYMQGKPVWEIELHDPRPYLDFIMKYAGLLESDKNDDTNDVPMPSFMNKK